MSLIWQKCFGSNNIVTISTRVWRIIEDQAKSSTRKLVTNSAEHEILEAILDDSKPTLAPDLVGLPYLLFTPFRYPPLKHGSRFGGRNERSILYASFELKTAMAETAFYRLAFLRASHANLGNKLTNLTAFNFKVQAKQAINLTVMPFVKYKQKIFAPTSYADSQPLGSAMRKDGIEAFISTSTRCKNYGKNINVISPSAVKNNTETELSTTFQHWSCFATQDSFEFLPTAVQNVPAIVFLATDFMVNSTFPTIPY